MIVEKAKAMEQFYAQQAKDVSCVVLSPSTTTNSPIPSFNNRKRHKTHLELVKELSLLWTKRQMMTFYSKFLYPLAFNVTNMKHKIYIQSSGLRSFSLLLLSHETIARWGFEVFWTVSHVVVGLIHLVPFLDKFFLNLVFKRCVSFQCLR